MACAQYAPRRTVFSILTMPDEHKQFRGNRKNFIDIISAGNEMGIEVYVVTTADLKLSQRFILGYRYDTEGKKWSNEMIPLPSVIYNRIPFREDELQPEVHELIRECLKHPRIHLYNPYFFNKWSLFEWLRRSSQTKKYIPATKKWGRKLSLRKNLQKHPLLYLKPETGKAGKGIMRLMRVSHDKTPFHLTIQDDRKSQTFKFKTSGKLREMVKAQMGEEPYIVQQGIQLAAFEARPFDLRVLIQKDTRGKWSLTGIGARVAGTTSITTHVPRGGSIDEPVKLLASAFGPQNAARLMVRVQQASLVIARQIERGSRQRLGEMSMDLGVDESGQIWFFEANSKPMKFDEPDIRKKSLQRLIQYGLYMSNRPARNSIKKGR